RRPAPSGSVGPTSSATSRPATARWIDRSPAANACRSASAADVRHAAWSHWRRPSTTGTASAASGCVRSRSTTATTACGSGVARSPARTTTMPAGPSCAPSAVTTPPRGPSPGWRSGTTASPAAASRSASPPMHLTGSAPASTSAAATRAARGTPPTSARTLSWPIRRLVPPVRTAPAAPSAPTSSAAVVHARVLHPEDLGVLVGEEVAVDDLADEEGVSAQLDGFADLAVDVGDGRGQQRSTGGGLGVLEAVRRPGGLVDLDGLGEPADDGAVLPGDRGERERA